MLDYSVEIAGQLLEKHYGMKGCLKELGSFEDRIFLIQTFNLKEKFILKISTKIEDQNLIFLQNYILKRLKNEKNNFKCMFPELILALDGQDMVTITNYEKTHFIRVFTFIEGKQIGELTDPPLHLFDEAGDLAGKISLLFEKLSKEKEIIEFNQNIKQQSHSFNLIKFNENFQKKKKYLSASIAPVVDKIKEEFNSVLPTLQRLPKQLVHYDLCLTNLLVAKKEQNSQYQISGIIDFGALFQTHAIIQLVILAARINIYQQKPLRNALRVIAAFNKVRKLSEDEKKILFILIKTRLAFLTLTSSFLAIGRENDPYFQRCKNGHFSYLMAFYNACSNNQFLQLLEEAIINI